MFGKDVKLVGGQTAARDDAYIRNSILNPGGQVVEGFQPIMPTFKGQVTEEQLVALVSYIKSLSGVTGTPAPMTATPATNSATPPPPAANNAPASNASAGNTSSTRGGN